MFALVTWLLNPLESQSESAIKTENKQPQLAFLESSQKTDGPVSHAEPSMKVISTLSGHSVRVGNADTITEFPGVIAPLNTSALSSHSQPLARAGQDGLSGGAVSTQPAAEGSRALLAAPVWEIDEGLPLPLVLSGGNSGRTEAMKAANESIAQKFEQDITTGGTDAPEVLVSDEVWVNAKSNADGIFKILYGDALYNARGMEAASSGLKQ